MPLPLSYYKDSFPRENKTCSPPVVRTNPRNDPSPWLHPTSCLLPLPPWEQTLFVHDSFYDIDKGEQGEQVCGITVLPSTAAILLHIKLYPLRSLCQCCMENVCEIKWIEPCRTWLTEKSVSGRRTSEVSFFELLSTPVQTRPSPPRRW